MKSKKIYIKGPWKDNYSNFKLQDSITSFQNIIADGLQRFIEHQILQFDDAREVPVHFIGSIAYFLKDEIELSFQKNKLKLGSIVQRPIDKLVNFWELII